MIEELKRIKLEDMAESMRHIVEEENADAHDNSNAQARVQQLNVLRKKPLITGKKDLHKVKMKAFKKELEKYFI